MKFVVWSSFMDNFVSWIRFSAKFSSRSMFMTLMCIVISGCCFCTCSAVLTFEKISDVYISASTSLSKESPVTLSGCVRSCMSKSACQATTFFVVNLTCVHYLDSVVDAKLSPQRNAYTFNKITISNTSTLRNCSRRLWAFERFPRKAIRHASAITGGNGLIKVLNVVLNRSQCLDHCLQGNDTICRAFQFDSSVRQCTLFANDRRMDMREFVDDGAVDYVENVCISGSNRCEGSATFERYNDVVFPAFYFDKSVPVSSTSACGQRCMVEPEFLCRSFIYDPANQQCSMSHNDRQSLDRAVMPALPRIYAAVLGRPLTEYYEATCLAGDIQCSGLSAVTRFSSLELPPPSVTEVSIPTSLSECQKLCLSNQSCHFLEYQQENSRCRLSAMRKQGGNPRSYVGIEDYLENTCKKTALAPTHLDARNVDSSTIGLNYSASRSPGRISDGEMGTTKGYRDASTISAVNVTVAPVGLNVTTAMDPAPQIGISCNFSKINGKIAQNYVMESIRNVSLENCQLHCETVNGCLTFSHSESEQLCLTSSYSLNKKRDLVDFIANSDFDFYEKGSTCTDIRFECTDNEIIIKVNLDKPFHGRLYVDGNRASQCNAKFANQRTFTWALPLSAQPCNTVYEGDGLFSNIVTLQYHDTIVTKNDRRYRINCKYDIGLINVTSETLSVLNPETSSLTANPVPPVLSIEITDVNGNGVESALIGETLLFTIAVPKDSPYGISSKNCYAVGEKQGERLQLTDDTGCPVLQEYFRSFALKGKSLQADFDAFRFQNSYDIIYQCTVQYCIDVCPQPSCPKNNDINTTRSKRELEYKYDSEDYIGSYNLRKSLTIREHMFRADVTADDLSQHFCVATSVGITIFVLGAALFLFELALVLTMLWLCRKIKAKM